jgi:plastocyanin
VAAAAWLAAGSASTAGAQLVTTRTPNLTGAWSARPGVVQFNFVHRFSVSAAPVRRVLNTPTFVVGAGLMSNLMVGFTYGSNSTLVPSYPNEWEFFARGVPLSERSGAPLDVSVSAGYNIASESFDAELLFARSLARLRVFAGGRVFSNAFYKDENRFALAAGAALRLTENLALAADYAALTDRADDEKYAWGAGVQVGVPYTPHSLSIHASNVGTSTLEGSSIGDRTRWGFEYTIPITLSRLFSSAPAAAPSTRTTVGPPGAGPATDSVFVDIVNLSYSPQDIEIEPGTMVVWVNRDAVPHTVTADNGAFDSGTMVEGARFAMTFTASGTYPYYCIPHPFMRARVVVGAAQEGNR